MIWASFDFSERVGCKIFATDIRIISAIIKVLDKEVLGFSGPTLGTGEEEEEEEELFFFGYILFHCNALEEEDQKSLF